MFWEKKSYATGKFSILPITFLRGRPLIILSHLTGKNSRQTKEEYDPTFTLRTKRSKQTSLKGKGQLETIHRSKAKLKKGSA